MTTETQQPAPGTVTETVTENNGGKTPGSESGDKRTFTQDEVNQIVGERARRSAESAVSKLLEGLGIKSPDELKTALDTARQITESQLSDQQKKDNALAKAKTDYDALTAELQREREARKSEKLDTAIIAAAKGAHDPDDVVKLLRNEQSDALTKAMNAEGVIDTKALDTLIADLKKKKGYLFGGSSPGSPSNAGGKPAEPDAKLKEEARLRLRRSIKSL